MDYSCFSQSEQYIDAQLDHGLGHSLLPGRLREQDIYHSAELHEIKTPPGYCLKDSLFQVLLRGKESCLVQSQGK